MAAHTANSAEYAQPPCRVAAKYVAPCPLCGRELSLKTLRYKHFCGDGPPRDVEAHSLAQQAAATKAVHERMRARSAATVSQPPVGLSAPSAQHQQWQSLLAASLCR
jgi:hypothetical protein